MKKILSLMAVSALVLTGCQSDEFAGNVNPSTTNEAISFGVNDVKATRGVTIQGEKAAALLNNNFIVYGYKLTGTETKTDANDQKVFDLYNVNYEKGTADLTQSNTNNWEYVGANPAAGSGASSQSIKYWDYSAKGYVFSAVSGLDITAEKITSTTSSVYGKGWNITIPAGGSLVGLYASARVPVANEWNNTTNKDWRYSNPVTLQFYSMASKVRFAMYETVPGYSIKVDKFYYTDGTEKSSTTNFVVDGTFKVLDNTNKAKAKITYYSDAAAASGIGVENCPKVTWIEGVVKKSAYMFGTNIQCNTLGTSSLEAVYDQAGGEYTYIIPFQKDDNTLSLKVDYTLTSTDGSGEVIKVYGATATVPANYTQWKENFAYTYLFKISDKTNGSTVDDPEGPKGLYPITFDACVIAEEEGIQETITSLGEPAITTYAQGEVVTVNDEYTAGDVYFSATQAKVLKDISGAKVYEVYNYGTGEITEALVEDYQKNKVVLVPVATTEATSVPLQDGSSLAFDAKMCYKFAAKAGKTYAIQYNYETGKYAYKIVKVAGTATDPTYTLTVKASTSPVTAPNGKVVFTLKSGTHGVVGALKNLSIFKGTDDVTEKFVITEGNPGNYAITLTDALIKEGADGTYTVKFEGDKAETTFTVDLYYVLRQATAAPQLTNNTLNIVAGKSDKFRLTIGQPASVVVVSGATIVNNNAGIVVAETSTPGTYGVSVAKTVAAGNYTVTIAGQTLTVEVTAYSFNFTENTLVWAEGVTATDEKPNFKLILSKKEGTSAAVAVDGAVIASSDADVAKGGTTNVNGALMIRPNTKGGKTTLSYENADCEVTINKYELKSDSASFKKGTGSSVVSLECNGEVVSASTAKAYVYKLNSSSVYDLISTGFSLTTKGQKMVFGNVAASGTYLINYYEGSTKVGYETFTVTD